MQRAVVGVAVNEIQAEIAVKRLQISGFPKKNISLLRAALSGTTGKVRDALESIGLPGDEANHCEEEVRNGRILVVARPDDSTSAKRAWMSFLEAGTGHIAGIGVQMPRHFSHFVPWPGQ
jgi:hypothetical protein